MTDNKDTHIRVSENLRKKVKQLQSLLLIKHDVEKSYSEILEELVEAEIKNKGDE